MNDMPDMSDIKAFETLQNFAMNKSLLKMFALGEMPDKELDTLKQVLVTFNRHGVSTVTVMSVFTDLFESGVFHAE